ncbi:ammonium transporter [Allostreptomyces psammosilenae]|uniref:Ammonium transporter n=1 Tax=Allostreptomyces psammosilenae TaxID=1892865 RepID=A0A853A109_9ACTN|nr:ammonium transporter [Allostreptomyces psammosilenae]NYI06614.1 Amt family ammonium transporter [Allostreptomyces psammosilenae]
MPEGFSAGDTAFVLVCAMLVMLMTPGLAFFYGGMVRAKSTLNMLMMSFISLGVVSVLWILFGYSLAFGPDVSGVIGNLDFVGMRNIEMDGLLDGYTIPVFAFVAFQLMFAILTPALISGAVADRFKFSAWVVFIALWVTIVYFPVAHWVWGGGWIFDIPVIDFAGGTAVHINAGVAALALVLVVGKRIGFKREAMRPHSLPLVMLGAGLLWFGWFGFNAGSGLAANGLSSVVLLNTNVAAAAAVLGWLVLERIRDGHFTSLGAASGAVAGLVAITPACSVVSPLGAIAIGLIAGVACAWAVGLKYRLGYDDSLDVVGVHLVGGIIGSLLIGLFATGTYGTEDQGLFYGGGLELLGRQAIGVAAVAVYSFVVTYVIALVLRSTIGIRASEDDERTGLDQVAHAETAYDFTGGAGVLSRSASPAATATGKPGRTDDADGGRSGHTAEAKVEA